MPKPSSARYRYALLACAGCFLAALYVSLTNGTFDISVEEVLKTLLRIDPVPEHDLVIFEYRLPRIVAGALVGFGLGAAGAVIQGITRNGLADPGILGINAGAGAAIVLFVFFFRGQFGGRDLLGMLAMPIFGLAGGLLAAAWVYWLAWRNGTLDPQRLILVGIAVGYGLGALALYVSLKMNPQDFEMAAVWLAGSIWNSNWKSIAALLPWFLVLIPAVVRGAHAIDLLQLGEDRATSLGVPAEKVKHLMLLGSIGITSVCVSVSGNIGFVGLLAPHIARRLAGIRHSRIIPLSGAVGMLLVTVSDFIAKTVFAPVELPVGIVTAIIGVPYFAYLLYKAKGVNG